MDEETALFYLKNGQLERPLTKGLRPSTSGLSRRKMSRMSSQTNSNFLLRKKEKLGIKGSLMLSKQTKSTKKTSQVLKDNFVLKIPNQNLNENESLSSFNVVTSGLGSQMRTFEGSRVNKTLMNHISNH